MKIRLSFITTMVLALGTVAGADAQDRQWSFRELLQNVHVAAFTLPAVCPAPDAIALYTFNASGRHPSQPAADVSELTYSIVGHYDDGRVVALSDDQGKVIDSHIRAGEDSIRCVSSAARAQGATQFAVLIQSARVVPRTR